MTTRAIAVTVLCLITAFVVGLTIRTPADRCAMDPDCATAPVNR